LFHLEAPDPQDGDLFLSYLTLAHAGGFGARLRGAVALLRALARRGRGARPAVQPTRRRT
ncbi:MAG TPA: cytochrome P450, partial [Thermoanaerobaculia bacterium]|nr:cytochrome P450 [Thermoanaerobaculia bacterium]